MKRYELKYQIGEEGIFKMSTVECPAVKSQLVMFDDEMALMQFQDDEKQIIYSVAMRPNMLIPRKNINGEPAMVFYSEETADNLLENFFKTNSHKGATVNHDKNIRDDMYIFSAWKVLDPERDASTVMGMQTQKGDIVMGQKIDNPDVWADVKSGKLTGLSFEAYLEPVLTNNEIEMTQEEIDARIKVILMQTEEEKKKAEEEAEAAKKLKMEEVPMVETPTVEDLQKKLDEAIAEVNDLKAKLSEYETKEVTMSAELDAAKKVALEMGEEMAKGIKPIGKPQEEMSALEKFREKKKNY